jgi:hypothetical protein
LAWHLYGTQRPRCANTLRSAVVIDHMHAMLHLADGNRNTSTLKRRTNKSEKPIIEDGFSAF